MSWVQALAYFLSEAALSLLRSWKVSLLAVLTISVTLFASGLFLWLSQNVAQTLESWRRDAVVVAYLGSESGEEEVTRLVESAQKTDFVRSARRVTSQEAEERFKGLFPSLGEVVAEWQDEDLPASVEFSIDADSLQTEDYVAWRETLNAEPTVRLVDDDQDWIARLERGLSIAQTVGWSLVAVLFATAIFTISSVVRLTAYLYREEIKVQRLVGATELFIRGPFYFEGILQGLLGSVMALVGLTVVSISVADAASSLAILGGLTADFLSLRAQLGLVAAGCLAGWFGAYLSLRKRAGQRLRSAT